MTSLLRLALSAFLASLLLASPASAQTSSDFEKRRLQSINIIEPTLRMCRKQLMVRRAQLEYIKSTQALSAPDSGSYVGEAYIQQLEASVKLLNTCVDRLILALAWLETYYSNPTPTGPVEGPPMPELRGGMGWAHQPRQIRPIDFDLSFDDRPYAFMLVGAENLMSKLWGK